MREEGWGSRLSGDHWSSVGEMLTDWGENREGAAREAEGNRKSKLSQKPQGKKHFKEEGAIDCGKFC